MPVTLSPNEIRARAAKFAELYKNAEREEAEAQSFQTDFLNVLGIDRRRVAIFEKKSGAWMEAMATSTSSGRGISSLK